ncbi:MAG TPA: RNA polymerase sigma factor [Caulobacterales bacterium]|nr:RNA polymerase sigma factor [Caulobacterales bacterium]
MTSAPSARDDASLVAAALAGESRAFTDLMRRHKEPIYRFIRRYVGDADEAYDLTQETFVAAWSGLNKYDSIRPLPTWLRRIALNKCRDWSRRRQVRRFFFRAEPIDAVAERIITREEAPDLEQDLRLSNLDRAIAALPAQLKEPLLLTQFDGLSHQAVAKALGLTAKTVETRVYRAKRALIQAMRRRDEG